MSSSRLTNTSLTIAGATAISGATAAGYINNINQNLGSTVIVSTSSLNTTLYPNTYQLDANFRIYVFQLNNPLTLEFPVIMLPSSAPAGKEIIIACAGDSSSTSCNFLIAGDQYTGEYSYSNIYYFYISDASSCETGIFRMSGSSYLHLVFDGTYWGVIAVTYNTAFIC